jgi:hypothetical protein
MKAAIALALKAVQALCGRLRAPQIISHCNQHYLTPIEHANTHHYFYCVNIWC